MTYRLPEPDYELMGYSFGTPTTAERAKWHGEWHRGNPGRACDHPEQPLSLLPVPTPMPFLNYGLLAALFMLVAVVAWVLR